MKALQAGGAFQLQHNFAAKADICLGDDGGVPRETTLLTPLDTCLGIFNA